MALGVQKTARWDTGRFRQRRSLRPQHFFPPTLSPKAGERMGHPTGERMGHPHSSSRAQMRDSRQRSYPRTNAGLPPTVFPAHQCDGSHQAEAGANFEWPVSVVNARSAGMFEDSLFESSGTLSKRNPWTAALISSVPLLPSPWPREDVNASAPAIAGPHPQPGWRRPGSSRQWSQWRRCRGCPIR